MEKREAFKAKSADISKGSIKKGVKKHKRAKKDHDDSDFVYPKQTKKSCKETISQAQTEITDPNFDTIKKDNSQLRFRNLNESILYKCVEPQKQAIIKKFLTKPPRS